MLYLVCFDLSSPPDQQRNQIKTWLQYLNSLLCLQSAVSPIKLDTAKWRVMVAGLKADKQQGFSQLTTTTAYQNRFPALPLVAKVFHISTKGNPSTANELFSEINRQCKEVMDMHLRRIPTAYTDLQQDLLSIASTSNKPIIHTFTIINTVKRWKDNPGLMQRALRHLHMIGEIVMLGTDRIFTDPLWISQLMAKFISPDEIRDNLLWNDANNTNLLSQQDVQCILGVSRDR